MPENMDYSQPLIALRESKLDGLFECSSISKFVESAVFPAVLCVLFIVALVTHWDSTKKLNAPRIGKNPWLSGLTRARADFVKNGHSLTEEGYAKYKDSMYWIQTGDMERLVLSNRYLDELRKIPDTHLSSRHAVVERNLGWYNRVDIILKSTSHVDVCRTQLVQNLGRVTDDQLRSLGDIFNGKLVSCFEHPEAFHFYTASETVLDIVNRATTRVIVGEPLCQNEIWLGTSLDVTINTGLMCSRLQGYPAFLRPFIYPFTDTRKNLGKGYRVARSLLANIIDDRQANGDQTDVLQWLIESNKGNKLDHQFLTNQVLFVSIAAARSTATSIVHALFDLIAMPQHQKPLREEIQKCLEASGGWNLSALQKMKKLDSFIKESQRFNHPLLFSFNRKTIKTISLSDGTVIPPGVFISIPAYWLARDPDVFEDGGNFNPWRFSTSREVAEREGRSTTEFNMSATSPTNLHWGYGRNACPGRFMAATEIKLITAWILQHFEMAFPGDQCKRPENKFVDERIYPNPMQKIGFRMRQAE